jgi:hypothetical protein
MERPAQEKDATSARKQGVSQREEAELTAFTDKIRGILAPDLQAAGLNPASLALLKHEPAAGLVLYRVIATTEKGETKKRILHTSFPTRALPDPSEIIIEVRRKLEMCPRNAIEALMYMNEGKLPDGVQLLPSLGEAQEENGPYARHFQLDKGRAELGPFPSESKSFKQWQDGVESALQCLHEYCKSYDLVAVGTEIEEPLRSTIIDRYHNGNDAVQRDSRAEVKEREAGDWNLHILLGRSRAPTDVLKRTLWPYEDRYQPQNVIHIADSGWSPDTPSPKKITITGNVYTREFERDQVQRVRETIEELAKNYETVWFKLFLIENSEFDCNALIYRSRTRKRE